MQHTADVESEAVEPDSISVIVDGLREKFGVRAAEVAAQQVERAAPETVGIWIEIAARLGPLS